MAIALSLFNFAVCYFREFVSFDVPLLTWGDDVGFLNNGTRILAGRLPYRDYFDFVAPGTEVTYALIAREFGAHSWTPNLMVALLAAVVAALMTLITARLVSGAFIALPGLLLAGFIMPGALDATHHWFSTIAVLGAVLVLLNGESLRHLSIAGGLCGLTALYTQSKGVSVALGFIAYLALRRSRDGVPFRDCWPKCAILLSVAIAVFFAGNAFFVRSAGLEQWWHSLFVFPLKYYGTVDVNNWHIYGHGLRTFTLNTMPFVFVHATVPLVYGICIYILCATNKEFGESDRNGILLLSVTGVAMFLSIALAPSWKRLCAVSPPAAILLSWLVYQLGPIKAKLRAVLAVSSVMLAAASVARSQLRWTAVLDLPVGKAALIEKDQYQEYQYLMGRTRRSKLMFAPPPWLFALGAQNPAPIDLFGPFDYTRPEQVSATIRALEENRVPLLLLNRGMFRSTVDLSPISDHLDPIRAYLAQRYRLAATFSNDDEVWERVDTDTPN